MEDKETLIGYSMEYGGTMKALISAGVVAVLIGGFWIFAPAYQTDKVVGFFTAFTSTRQCYGFYKKDLKDPETAYMLSGSTDELDAGRRVNVSYRAKNGFGAYSEGEWSCPLKEDGSFDELHANLERWDDRLGGSSGGNSNDSTPPVVDRSEYDQIREGMSYSEVTAIIGATGEEMSRSDIAGYSTVAYMWRNSSGSNMNAMFQNGRLVVKSQFGLP